MPYTILYYTDCKFFGGAEEYLLTVFKKIDRGLWHPVLLYHPSAGNAYFVDEVRNLNVDTVSVPEVRNFLDVIRIFKIITKLKSVRPAILHANLNWPLSCTYGIISAAIVGIKIIVATQHLYEDSVARRKYLKQKIVSSFVNRYIAVSNKIAKEMKEIISPDINVDVSYNGILIEDYNIQYSKDKHNDVLREWRSNKNSPIILTVARLHKQKGHIYLIEAATKIKEAVFVFAGDGPERGNLENYAKKLNVDKRVIFLGHRDDIPYLIKGCDLFVLPSLFEGLPLTIMEAMAAGKPVVASNIDGINEEVLHKETGLLVPIENPVALAGAINSLISNPIYAKELGDAGRIRAQQQFSAERMLAEITDLYEELLNIAR